MPIDTVTLATADGERLEGELSRPAGPVRGAVVLAHPHPLHGGDMHAGLIGSLFELLPPAGLTTLRFNFRGVGRSSGEHDGGRAERLDVAAAIDHLAGAEPGAPLLAVGWSFGAVVSLQVAHPALAGWVAVAPPLGLLAGVVPAAGADARPLLVLVPEHDQLCPPDVAGPIVAGWTATRLEVLPGTDHGLWGGAAAVATCVVAQAAAGQAG